MGLPGGDNGSATAGGMLAASSAAAAEAARVKTAESAVTKDVVAERPLRILNNNLYDLSLVMVDTFKSDYGIHRGLLWSSPWCVRGKILSVVEDGLLINCNQAGNVFLKHYPGFSSELTDGASVACFAIPDGRYQYKAVSGAQTTVPALDCGRIFDPKHDHFALMSRFTQDGPVSVKVLSQEELAALKTQAETAKAQIKAKVDDAVLKFQMEQAENGSPDNQYKTGLRYLTGDGVPANKSKAIEWLTKASAQGNKDADEALAKANKTEEAINQQTQLPIVSRSN
jgi:hypothetical protein